MARACNPPTWGGAEHRRRQSLALQVRALSDPRVSPTYHPSLVAIGWAAGIYEGEGCVYKTPSGHSLRCHVDQKDPEILHRLQSFFGGHVDKATIDKRRPEFGHSWRWRVEGIRGLGFLMTIYVLLSTRRQQQLAAAFAALKR